MQKLARILFVITVLSATSSYPQRPDIGTSASLVLGDVVAIQPIQGQIQIRTKGGFITVIIDTNTEFRRVSPDKLSDLKDSVPSRLNEIGPMFRGEYQVIMRDGTQLKLSHTYRDNPQRNLGGML